MSLNNLKLVGVFQNLEKVDQHSDGLLTVYRVIGSNGGDLGTISISHRNELNICVDNFPGDKLYYQSNLPVSSIDQFRSDVERTGLKLVLNP